MKHYGLIGCPLGHSASADFFAKKFACEAIDADYTPYELADVSEVETLRGRLSGFNVTIPYKQQIMPLLASVSDEARAIGAVNCVKVDSSGAMHGYNTDVEGIRASLKECDDLRGCDALVFGTGGAAAAVRYVLSEMGCRVSVVSRREGEGVISYGALTAEDIARARLLVNTTPLGMWPNIEACPPIPYEALSPGHTLFDVVYNPPMTEFLRRGTKAGARTISGEVMFCCQAEASWRIWNE